VSKEFKLVKVEWEDSRQPIPEWQFLEGFETPDVVKCVTVGFLIRDGKKQKAICQNMGDYKQDMQVSGVITIPSSCISNITTLKESI
jgi:hypothetical protein